MNTMEFTLEEIEVKFKEEPTPTETNTHDQIQIDPMLDWKLKPNVESRVNLERIENISSENYYQNRVKVKIVEYDGSTFNDPYLDIGQDETYQGTEQVEKFIQDPLEIQTLYTEGEIDIKFEVNDIESNLTSDLENDLNCDPDSESGSSKINTEPVNQDSITTEEVKLNEFYLGLLHCEQDCEICQVYMQRLSEHVRATHLAGQPIHDPLHTVSPEQDDPSAVEIKCEVDENIQKIESCCVENESDPDYNTESCSDSGSDPDYVAVSSNAIRKVIGVKGIQPTVQKIKDAQPTGGRQYVCKICGEGCVSKYRLSLHRMKHTGGKLFKCDECPKSFLGSKMLRGHKRIHIKEKPYKCTECEKSFRINCLLTQHMRSHTGERPYDCTVCEKSFSTNAYLVYHMRSHTGERPYQCDNCEMSFTRKDRLTTHRRCHSLKERFKCDECSKSYTTKTHLKVHKRIHTGERPYKCDQCEKAFTRPEHLSQHKRMKIHAEDFEFKCEECNRGFSRQSHLITHKIIHTGEAVYECD